MDRGFKRCVHTVFLLVLVFFSTSARAHAGVVLSDLVVFTKPGLDLAGKNLGDLLQAILLTPSDVLKIYGIPEATVTAKGTVIPNALIVNEGVGMLLGLTLNQVPAGTASTTIQLFEPEDATILSDALAMTVPANRIATFSFNSDAVNEPSVKINPNLPNKAEDPSKFVSVTADLFPRVAAGNLPYRVFIMSDCGAPGDLVCQAPNVLDNIPEPSTWLLFSTALSTLLVCRHYRFRSSPRWKARSHPYRS